MLDAEPAGRRLDLDFICRQSSTSAPLDIDVRILPVLECSSSRKPERELAARDPGAINEWQPLTGPHAGSTG